MMIESVNQSNLEDVLPLIAAYQHFYKVPDVSDERNRSFFAQFGDNSELGCQFLVREEGKAVSFGTVYFCFASSAATKIGILNDLFTIPECRGKGYARLMIEHCRQYARSRGATRLQWMTAG